MLLALCFVCLVGAHIGISQQLGERCVVDHSGMFGVCADGEVCRSVYEDLERELIPTFCSLTYTTVVVCCTDFVSILNALRPPQNPVSNQAVNNINPNLRVSERKCEEYSRLVTDSFRFVPLVVGGEGARPGEFPHIAAVGWQSTVNSTIKFRCAGSLVSSRFVLSTATCFYYASPSLPTMVRLGDHNLDPAVDDGASPIDVEIKRSIIHPDFDPSTEYNDIALLELARHVDPGPAVRPACLWTSPDLAGRATAIAAGWGRTYSRARKSSNALLKVELSLMDNDHCNQLMKGLHYRNWRGLIESQVCAGDSRREKGTCYGDAGTPLQVASPNNSCVFHVMGLTSLVNGCARATIPSVFTRVAYYLDWIESIVWPGE